MGKITQLENWRKSMSNNRLEKGVTSITWYFSVGLSNAKDDSSVSGKFSLRINFDPLKPLKMVMLWFRYRTSFSMEIACNNK